MKDEDLGEKSALNRGNRKCSRSDRKYDSLQEHKDVQNG